MQRFWTQTPEIPGHVWIREVSHWISLLAVNEVWELNGVLDEKDWSVVPHHVVIAFFSIELYSESSRISICICSSPLSSDCGESEEHRGSFAHCVKELCSGVPTQKNKEGWKPTL